MASITTAMILAAGRGERMRPLTDQIPKPLLSVGGKNLIEWQINALVRAGIERIIINHAWLGEQFAERLGDGQRYGCTLLYSAETKALETAGGIIKAIKLLGNEPFIVTSGDIYTHFDYQSLPSNLGGAAAHLVLVPNPTYHQSGDMGWLEGYLSPQAHERYTYANIGVFSPHIFQITSAAYRESALKLFPWLYQQGPISGQLYTGEWHNIGTPAQLGALNDQLNQANPNQTTTD